MTQVGQIPSGTAGGAATTGTGRVGNVDVLRAIAALTVLVGHAYSLGGRSVSVRAQHWYDVPLITASTGVWLFFAISGYVISRPFVDRLLTGKPLPDLGPYALRRALRIFPLYWIALLAVILIGSPDPTRAWQYPFHVLLLNNLIPGRQEALFSVAWTLTLEVIFYAAVPVLALAARRWQAARTPERLAGWLLVSWALSICFTLGADLAGGGRYGLWLRGSFPAMWQMFCPGILLAILPHMRAPVWRRRLPALAGTPALAATVVVLLAAAVIGADTPLRFGVVAYQVIVDASRPLFAVGYGLLLLQAIVARPWGREGGWLGELGMISYGIYLLHAVVIRFLLHHLDLVPLRDTSLAAFVVHALLVAALTVPLAVLSWRLLERPLIELSRRLAKRWTDHRQAAARLHPGRANPVGAED